MTEWPSTRRIAPWGLTLFVVVFWLLPVQDMHLISLGPLEMKPDRVSLGVIFGCMALTWIARGGGPRLATARIPSGIAITATGFGLIVVAGIVANAFRITHDGDFNASVRSSLQFVFYAALLFAAFHIPRPAEAARLIDLMLVLALIAAFGVLVEYSTNFNVFYEIANKLAIGGYVTGPPADLAGDRRSSVGPTEHGLEITTMFAMMLPFLISTRARLPKPSQRTLTAIAAILIIAGGVATLRRTALILPVISLVVLVVLHRPSRRQIGLLIPIGAVVGPFVAPGALQQSYDQLTGKSAEGVSSSAARANDYAALVPDFQHYFLLGRGQGAFTVYERILDNSFLGILVQNGALGLTAYLLLLGFFMKDALHIRRDPRPHISALGSALAAAITAYTASNALFDTISFIHVPYLLILLSGLTHVAAWVDPLGASHAEPSEAEHAPAAVAVPG